MRLTIVGCAGSFPTADSAGSCYLLEHEGSRIVLDLGNGALGALQQHVDLSADDSLAGVVLSHCHVDHCADVGSLYVLRQYRPSGPYPRLPILGASDTADRLAAIYGMDDPTPLRSVFGISAFGPAPTAIGPFTIEAVRAAHPVEAYSIRVTAGGRSITYSGDTGPTTALTELARGTDVALFEASFVGDEGPPDLHLTARDAGRLASAAGAGRLLLTHHVLWNDPSQVLAEAREAFGGEIQQARAGLTVTV